MALLVVGALLLYLPVRVMRGFPASVRVTAWVLVAVKAVILVGFHLHQIGENNHPIVLDESTDAKGYYDVGSAVMGIPLWQLTVDDVIDVRGGTGNLAYYMLNVYAFQVSPDHPILLIRLFKLLFFSVATGMLASVWLRRTGSVGRSFFGYIVLSVFFYQFLYFTFRNLKDDLILSLFILIMAIVDGYLVNPDLPAEAKTRGKTILRWGAVAVLVYVMSSMRFYAGLAVVCGLAAHTVIGPGMKASTRVVTSVLFLGGFVALMGTAGGALVASEGGLGAIFKAAANIGGVFKIIVTPVPWKHQIPWQIPAHLVYLLLLLPAAMVAFIARIRQNLDWKLVVVCLIALAVGGHILNFSPRKRFMMYPVFMSWVVMMGRRRLVEAGESDEAKPFDVDAYFARHGAVT